MTTKRHHIDVQGMSVEIVRKDIKNLHLGVYPTEGRVRVAVPVHLDDEAVRLAVISRLGWIRRQKRAFERQARQSQREMINGESHFYQGRRYLLDVVEADCPPSISLPTNKKMVLQVRPGADRDKREAVLRNWYRQRMREQIPELLARWEAEIGVKAARCDIRKMKTRWGSCSVKTGRILLNLELAKKPPACLEYILVHELVHLLAPHHDDQFREYMDHFLPQWRIHRDELNKAPLSNEDWRY
jgi:hypothetical protein